MKNSIFTFLLSLLFLWGCNNAPATLSDAEKEQIKSEVKQVFDQGIKAANEHNAAAMTENDWNSPDYIYVSNGTLIKGWKAKFETAHTIHSNPVYQSFTVNYNETIIHVISREAAMVTGNGYFRNFPAEQGPKDIKFTVTFLYEKINGKWVMTAGHESTHEQLF